jgi:hypothetical protein
MIIRFKPDADLLFSHIISLVGDIRIGDQQ